MGVLVEIVRCKKPQGCLQMGWLKISVRHFIRRGVIQTLMGFGRVVEVIEADEFGISMGFIPGGVLARCHVHQGSGRPLRLLPLVWGRLALVSGRIVGQ